MRRFPISYLAIVSILALLFGGAISAAASTTPAVSLSPAALNFGSITVGSTSSVQYVTVTNSGGGSLNFSSAFSMTGDFAFGGTGTCRTDGPLTPGSSCTVSVKFAPKATGTRTGTITLTSNASTSPQTIALTGIGVAPGPAVSLSPASLNFGSINVGSTSSVQYVTVTNTGSASLSFSSTFSMTGDFASAGTGTCSTSGLAAGGSCTISVKFVPTATGTRTGTISLTDNAPTSPQMISLTGTGGSTAASVATSVSPTSAALQVSKTQQFGATVSGTTNTAVNWQVNGITGGNSTVGTISAAGLYTAPATVPSGGSVSVAAISAADTTKSASASVTVAAAPAPVSVTVSPTNVSLSGGRTQQFTGSVSGTTNTGITWQVNGVTGGSSSTGTINSSGLYTAPTVSNSTVVTITARSAYDATQSANATANIAATSSGPALYVSTTGSSTSNCTATAPCATIARASSLATPGTTIHVAPGTYTGNFATSVSGTASARITYLSDTKWGAKLVGSGTGVLWQLNASYVDVVGFDISGPNNYGIYAGWSGTTPGYDHFLYNRIHDITNSAGCTSTGGAAIATGTGGAGYDWFIGNVVANIGASMIGSCNTIQGLYIANANALVHSNQVSGVAAFGIQQWHGATASIIVNNTVFNCKGGILLGDGDGGSLPGGSSDNYVANNISVRNTAYGIVEGGTMGSNNIYTDNLLWSNAQNYVGNGQVSGTVSSDPLFVSYQANGSGDYHVTSASPAVYKGTSTNAPATDITGQAQTTPVTLGAYAYR